MLSLLVKQDVGRQHKSRRYVCYHLIGCLRILIVCVIISKTVHPNNNFGVIKRPTLQYTFNNSTIQHPDWQITTFFQLDCALSVSGFLQIFSI